MSTDELVIEHYARARIAEQILLEARKTASDPRRLTIDDLGAYDEFHIGGRRATEYLFSKVRFTPDVRRILDIGCGIGGAARYIADQQDVHVTGLDLTPEFVETAKALSAETGLTEKTDFIGGSALSLPFEDGSFDMAFTIHAAMNIKSKGFMYREAYRVLEPKAQFAIYDILAGGAGPVDLHYPVPWAQDAQTSFLATPEGIRDKLRASGFDIALMEDRRDFALETFRKAEGEKPPPYRPVDFPQKVSNLRRNVEEGRCCPWVIVCRRH